MQVLRAITEWTFAGIADAARWLTLYGVGALAIMQAPWAAADELSDLKTQVQQMKDMNSQLTKQIGTLTEKIERIEAQQTQQARKVEQVEQKAAAAPAGLDALKGSFPRSIRIPGTETSLRIGGYLKGDFIYDVHQRLGDFIEGFRFSVDPDDLARKGHVRLTARQSRLFVETRTPTPLGGFRTYVEGDFYGDNGSIDDLVSNSTLFRIRQAYGELGPLLAGQTWTNFQEPTAIPEMVEFNGPVGQNFLRQAQVRYTFQLAPGNALSLALENPSNDIAQYDENGQRNHVPDMTARYQAKGDWGTASFYVMGRRLSNDTRTSSDGSYDSAFGWGVGSGGSIKTIGKDKIQYAVSYGHGMGRYLDQSVLQAGGVDANGRVVLTDSYGGYINYQHWWTPDLRSNFAYGVVHNRNKPENMGAFATSPADGGPSNILESFHGNLFWSPLSDVNLGVEYIWGHRERAAVSDAGGFKGNLQRLQATAQFFF